MFPSWSLLGILKHKYSWKSSSSITRTWPFGDEKQEETSRTIIDIVREKVEKLPAPATKKARVYTILDRLAANEHTKIYTIRELEYEEYISVSDDRLVVTQRMLDYAGATIDRNEYILKSDKIIGYVEEHKDTIDKELTAKVRRR